MAGFIRCLTSMSVNLLQFQACYLLADDIMDGSKSRRGQPCWHLVGVIGKSAINDAFILDGFIYYTLNRVFGDKPYFKHLIRLFHDSFFKTALGQCADTRNSNEIDSNFTMNVYSKIVKYKTSYYTLYLPVACAMIMVIDRYLYAKMLAGKKAGIIICESFLGWNNGRKDATKGTSHFTGNWSFVSSPR